MEQKNLEQYFQEYRVIDPDLKIKILPEITDIIYDRNMHAVHYEEVTDEYKKKQILDGIEELEDKIERVFKKYLK